MPLAGAPIPAEAHPSTAFTAALPQLRAIHHQLQEALLPTMSHNEQQCGFSSAAWMLAKGLNFLLQAAGAEDPRNLDLALAEVDVNANATTAHIRDLRAVALPLPDLTAADDEARTTRFDLGDCLATVVTARVEIGADDRGQTDQICVELDAGGRIGCHSHRHGQLPIDGRTHLDLSAVLEAIGEAYDRMLSPDPVVAAPAILSTRRRPGRAPHPAGTEDRP